MEDEKNVIKETKKLVNQEIELLKVNLVEKLSKVITTFFVVLIAVMLAIIAFIYFSFAISNAIKSANLNPIYVYLIIGGLFVILLILLLVLAKKKVIVNKFVKKFTTIIFDTKKGDNTTANITSTTKTNTTIKK